MKTQLPETINSVEDAQAFLHALYTNGEHYHPEDDAHDIIWDTCDPPTDAERTHLNILRDMMYALPECAPKPDDEGGIYMDFDPCGYLLDLDGHVIE